MKFILGLVVILGFAACDSGGGGGGQPKAEVQISNAKPGTGEIVIVGDSLATGYGAFSDENKPAGCLARLPHDQVTQIAVEGGTTQDAFYQLRDLKTKPKLIFISAGGNDAMREIAQPQSYPPGKTDYFTERIFNKALETGALVVYLGLDVKQPGAERLPVISSYAYSKGVIVVDGMNGMWNNKDLMFDEIHPNDEGYKIMCERILKAIEGYYP